MRISILPCAYPDNVQILKMMSIFNNEQIGRNHTDVHTYTIPESYQSTCHTEVHAIPEPYRGTWYTETIPIYMLYWNYTEVHAILEPYRGT